MTPSTPKSQLTRAQPPGSGAAGGAGLVSCTPLAPFFLIQDFISPPPPLLLFQGAKGDLLIKPTKRQ